MGYSHDRTPILASGRIVLSTDMFRLRRLHSVLACWLLLVIVTGWFVVPFGTWVPKLVGCEHVIRLALDEGDIHFAIQHADGTRDHRYHGPNCPRHHAPYDDRTDHPKHGVHLPHFESKTDMGVSIPAPVLHLSSLLFEIHDLSAIADFRPSAPRAPAVSTPPVESHKTVVLLI